MVTDTQNNVVDLYDCILIRDGLVLLRSWFLKSDLQTIVSCLCTTLSLLFTVFVLYFLRLFLSFLSLHLFTCVPLV